MIDRSSGMDHAAEPGDRGLAKRIRRHVTGRIREYFAITLPGVQDTCRQELLALGIDPDGCTPESGGVAFQGRLVDCLRANLHLRTATRILLRIDTFAASNMRRLEKKTGGIAWELFLRPGTIPAVKVSSRRSRLYHSAAIAGTIQAAIASRIAGSPDSRPALHPQTLFIRVVDDRFMLSLDSSGAPLYKRGVKAMAARAPIRETLAAAILVAAGYDPDRPLVDPMCGSGSFSLEAAMLAKRIAPGIHRDFAFMGWPAFVQSQWTFLKREAEERVVRSDRVCIFASDIDGSACDRLADVVAENDLSDAVRVFRNDFFDCEAGQYDRAPGLVVINPPYGIRIGSPGQADHLFRDICRHLERGFKGWRVAMIVPRQALVSTLPFAATILPLWHGGLRLMLAIGTIKG